MDCEWMLPRLLALRCRYISTTELAVKNQSQQCNKIEDLSRSIRSSPESQSPRALADSKALIFLSLGLHHSSRWRTPLRRYYFARPDFHALLQLWLRVAGITSCKLDNNWLCFDRILDDRNCCHRLRMFWCLEFGAPGGISITIGGFSSSSSSSS